MSDVVEKEFLRVLVKHEEMARDLGSGVYNVDQGNSDRTVSEQECVSVIQESSERCRIRPYVQAREEGTPEEWD